MSEPAAAERPIDSSIPPYVPPEADAPGTDEHERRVA